MLDFQISQAPMRFGLAEGVEPHQVPFGTLTTAENMCWTKSGLLEHRLGSQALATSIVGGGGITSAERLFVRGSELALTDGRDLYTHTSSGWASRGAIPNIGITWATMTSGLNTIRTADLVVVGSTIVEAWIAGRQTSEASNVLYYRITDLTEGALVTAPADATNNSRPHDQFRVVSDGTSSWIIYVGTTGLHNGRVYVLPVGGTAVQVATDAAIGGSTFALDAIMIGSDIVIAYTLAAGGIALLRVAATSTPSVSATGTVTGEASTEVSTVSLSGTSASEALFIAWATTNDGSGTDYVRYACANASTLAQTLAVQDLSVSDGVYPYQVATVAAARYSATEALLCYHIATQSVGASQLISQLVDSSGGVGDEGGHDDTFAVLSRPTLIGSRWLVTVANYPGEAGVFFTAGTTLPTSEVLVLDITPSSARAGGTPVQQGKIECLTGSFWAAGFYANVSSSYLATPFADAAPYGASGMVAKVLTGARRTKLTDGGNTDMWRSIALGQETVFAAGTLCSYDGERARGYGFATGPLVSTLLTNTSTTGGTLAAGRYLYNVTAERRSASGLLYRSPNGLSKAVTTTGATSSNVIGVVAAHLDRSDTNPGALLGYRSVVGGSIVQRLAVPPATMTLLLNSTSDTITDTQSDSSAGLSIRPALYTEGGELEDMQPPSVLAMAYHQNRLWMLAGDGTTVWFSKDRSVNPGIAPGFHPSLTFSFDRTLTAIAPLDDKLIVFAANTLWAILGQGPAPNGQNGTYEIVAIQSDVGCTNARSIVSTPDGIMFECERGIYLLTRSLELQWIGRPIKDELASYTDITSAVLVASRNEIRFTANGTITIPNPTGSTEDPFVEAVRGIVLVYNYVERQWTTSKYWGYDALYGISVYGVALADACMWQGRWTAATTDGTVFYETTADAWDTDASAVQTWVPATVETAWVTATGPLAYQSVRNFSFEGVAKSAHSLTIEVGFDSEDAYPQTKTFDVAAGAETFDISIGTRRKCRSIRFRITDAAPAGEGDNTGEGLSIAMLGVEVGLKRGFAKKPATKTG